MNLLNKKNPDFILKLKNSLDIELLTTDYANEIDSFVKLFNDFFQLFEGKYGSSALILNDCPPSKVNHKDKFVLGLYDADTMIGLVDLIRDYPEKGCWTIGYSPWGSGRAMCLVNSTSTLGVGRSMCRRAFQGDYHGYSNVAHGTS